MGKREESMTEPNEAGKNVMNEQIIIEQEVRDKIKEALNQGKKKEDIAKDLLDELEKTTTAAEQVKEAAKNNPLARNIIPQDAKNLGKEVQKAVIKVLVAIQEGVIHVEKNTKKVLTEIIKKGITPEAATFLHPFIVDYVTGQKEIEFSSLGGTETQFEKDFEILKQTNPEAARILSPHIQQLAKEQGLSEEEVRKRFEIKSQAETDYKETEEIRAVAVEISQRERGKIKEFFEKLAEKIKNAKDPNITMSKLDEIRAAIFRRGGSSGLTEEQKQLLRDSFGFSQAEIEEIEEIGKKTTQEKLTQKQARSILVQYGFPAEDLILFDFRELDKRGYIDKKDGKVTLTPEGRREIKKVVLRLFNKLFEPIRAHPEEEAEKHWNPYQDEQIYKAIQRLLLDLSSHPELESYTSEEGAIEFRKELEGNFLHEFSRERELRFVFHNVAVWMKTIQDPKQIAELISRYNVSTLIAPVMSDVSGKLIALAMSEYENYLRFEIMKNGGRLRPGLFANFYDPTRCYTKNEDALRLELIFRDKIKVLRRYGKENPEIAKKVPGLFSEIDLISLSDIEDWEIERALSYAKGISLLVTLNAYEAQAGSRPLAEGDFTAVPNNVMEMIAFMNPSHKWRLGRGFFYPLVPELKHIPITVRPKKSLLRRIFTKGWNPKELHERVKEHAEMEEVKAWERIKDSWLYRDFNFRKLLNIFGLGGLATRASWRLKGIEKEFKGFIEKLQQGIESALKEQFDIQGQLRSAFGEDWEETYKVLAGTVGVGARFFYDGRRAEEFVKGRLWEILRISQKVEEGQISQGELDHLWQEYLEGRNNDKEIFSLPDGTKLTLFDYLEAKTLVFRGMNFFALLKRSPQAFLNNLQTIHPWLLIENLGGVADYYYEFDEKKLRELLNRRFATNKKGIPEEFRKVRRAQAEMQRIWGNEDNIRHLQFIRKFYQLVEVWGGGGNEALDKLYRQLTLATEKARLRQDPIIRRDDIEDPILRTLVFGGEFKDTEEASIFLAKLKEKGLEREFESFVGLIPYFEQLNENFGVIGGKDKEFGQLGFFYHMARGWYQEIGHSLHPNTSDVDWRYIFHKLGAYTGESVSRRMWSDLSFWNELIKDLNRFDQILMEAAESHSLKPIEELMLKIKQLENIVGTAKAQEANWYITQLTARYFQEHYSARLPFPLGLIIGLFLRKNISLSKIKSGVGAMSMTTDGLNAWFQKLAHSGLIAEEGQFGFDNLCKAVGVDWQKFIATELIWNIASALILFLLWKFISEAFKEAKEKNK